MEGERLGWRHVGPLHVKEFLMIFFVRNYPLFLVSGYFYHEQMLFLQLK